MRPMLDRSINVGIATDAANSSDSLNMFEAARLASLISRVQIARLSAMARRPMRCFAWRPKAVRRPWA